MISKAELKQEQDYLRTVLYLLEKEIAKHEANKTDFESNMTKAMKYIWELGSVDSDEWNNVSDVVKQYSRGTIYAENNLKAYRRMLGSAYFARIDFNDGTETTPIYLGIASLKDGSNFYIYDWRAPICSPFYDNELGEASYTLPDGTVINGTVTLKRQYKIENDVITEIFDTNMQIVDDILTKILSSKGGNKMKNIVATIQKEQNRIIRKTDTDILAVIGPAGSGKTSVALHRIAYLLYADKNNLNKTNMLILSPNETFSDYISDVLPQMGEENVFQSTFYDYVLAQLKDYKIKNNMNSVYEELFIGKKTKFYNSINYKYWPGYISLIETTIQKNKYKMLGVDADIVIDGETIATAEFLKRFVDNTLTDSALPISEQLKLVNEKITSLSSVKLFKNQKAKNKLQKMLALNAKNLKAKIYYNEIYSSLDAFIALAQNTYNELGTKKQERMTIKELKDVYEYTTENISKGVLSYEDVMPFLYLKERLNGSPEQLQIKHVVIDEAQDYTPVQYKIVSNIFKRANMTLLGDPNQSIMPFVNYENFNTILNTLSTDRARAVTETQYLTKTYRSTVEINKFANQILGKSAEFSRTQMDRHGDAVSITKLEQKGIKAEFIADAIELKKKYNTVAIIYKTDAECKELQKVLSKTDYHKEFTFLSDENSDFTSEKIMVMPIYIAKGLEFDAVLIPNVEEDNYNKDNKKLFYVASTRAMHTLKVYYDGIPSSLILKN